MQVWRYSLRYLKSIHKSLIVKLSTCIKQETNIPSSLSESFPNGLKSSTSLSLLSEASWKLISRSLIEESESELLSESLSSDPFLFCFLDRCLLFCSVKCTMYKYSGWTIKSICCFLPQMPGSALSTELYFKTTNQRSGRTIKWQNTYYTHIWILHLWECHTLFPFVVFVLLLSLLFLLAIISQSKYIKSFLSVRCWEMFFHQSLKYTSEKKIYIGYKDANLK